jgi:hypothetical protein
MAWRLGREKTYCLSVEGGGICVKFLKIVEIFSAGLERVGGNETRTDGQKKAVQSERADGRWAG